MISWSRVRHFPPALTIFARAVSVNLSAATVILGTSRSLLSSVTVATETTILSLKGGYFNGSTYCPFRSWLILETEIGGLLILEEINLLNTVLVKAESVLLDRNLKSLIRRCRYKLLLLVSFLLWFLIRPRFTRSIPYNMIRIPYSTYHSCVYIK